MVIERCIGVRREDTKPLERREEDEEEEPGNVTQPEGLCQQEATDVRGAD